MSENDIPVEGEIVPVAPSQFGLSLGSMPMSSPANIVQHATEVAKVLTKVVRDQHLSLNIQGREYLYVTAWSTLCAMLGIAIRETPNGTYIREDGSYIGAVELIRMSDGMVIGGGTAVVGMDEVDKYGKPTWGNRPEYARRSMAVTRAAGKAARLLLSWVVVLAGFQPTPAEEMEGLNLDRDTSTDKATGKPTNVKPVQKPTQKAQNAPSAPHSPRNGSLPANAPDAPQSAYRAPIVLRSAVQANIQARITKNGKKGDAATDKAVQDLAIKWSNVMAGTTPKLAGDKERYAIVGYLLSVEISTFKGFAVATVEALDYWLHNDPKAARIEAGNIYQDIMAAQPKYADDTSDEAHEAGDPLNS